MKKCDLVTYQTTVPIYTTCMCVLWCAPTEYLMPVLLKQAAHLDFGLLCTVCTCPEPHYMRLLCGTATVMLISMVLITIQTITVTETHK